MITTFVALSVIAPQQRPVSYEVLAQTEARSPQAVHARLIRDKRTAFDFFLLLKPGAKKPLSMKRINWRRNNVLTIYPGLVQADAQIRLLGLSRNGRAITPSVLIKPGKSKTTKYPIIVLRIPRQPASVVADDVVLQTPRIQIQVSQRD